MTPWRAAAIDLGAESGRVVVGELAGGAITLSEVHRFANRPVRMADRLHWDVLALHSEVLDGLTRAHGEHGELASVGVDAWGVDFALLDSSGELLGNPYHYRDCLTDGALERVLGRVPSAELFAQTGIQPLRINTLVQLFALARARPWLLDVAARLLWMPDLFHYWLGGEQVTERTIATTSQAYDTQRDVWATPVLEALALPSRLLPSVVTPGTVLGPLLPAVRSATGLVSTCVVVPASHDSASAVAAVPAAHEHHAFISSGTWSVLGIVVPAPIVTHAIRDAGFTNEGGVDGTTRLLKNITGLWLVQQCRLAWTRVDEPLDYPTLIDLAERCGPFDAVIDPDHPSLRSPESMPDAIRARCVEAGERVPTSRGEIVRVAFESLACKYRFTIDALEEVTGRRCEVIHIVGGGSRNRLLCQLTADVCARPVLAGPVETTALGNVLAQAVAAGEVGSWSDARELARRSFTPTAYDPRDSARWAPTYERLRQRLATPGGVVA